MMDSMYAAKRELAQQCERLCGVLGLELDDLQFRATVSEEDNGISAVSVALQCEQFGVTETCRFSVSGDFDVKFIPRIEDSFKAAARLVMERSENEVGYGNT